MRGRFSFLVGACASVCAIGCSVDARTLWVRLDSTGFDAGQPLDPNGVSAHNVDSGPPITYPTDSGTGASPLSFDAGPLKTNCLHLLDGGCGATLVENPDFDTDLTGWASDGQAVVHWIAFDVQGRGKSGSMGVKNAEKSSVDGLTELSATQCIPAVPGTKYQYQSGMYIAKGQPFGAGRITVWFYDQPDCAGDVDGAYLVSDIQITGVWIPGSGTLRALDTVKSQSIHLAVQKAFRDGPVEVVFDAVRVSTWK